MRCAMIHWSIVFDDTILPEYGDARYVGYVMLRGRAAVTRFLSCPYFLEVWRYFWHFSGRWFCVSAGRFPWRRSCSHGWSADLWEADLGVARFGNATLDTRHRLCQVGLGSLPILWKDWLTFNLFKILCLKLFIQLRLFFVRNPSQSLQRKCGTRQFWRFENEFQHFEIKY